MGRKSHTWAPLSLRSLVLRTFYIVCWTFCLQIGDQTFGLTTFQGQINRVEHLVGVQENCYSPITIFNFLQKVFKLSQLFQCPPNFFTVKGQLQS